MATFIQEILTASQAGEARARKEQIRSRALAQFGPTQVAPPPSFKAPNFLSGNVGPELPGIDARGTASTIETGSAGSPLVEGAPQPRASSDQVGAERIKSLLAGTAPPAAGPAPPALEAPAPPAQGLPVLEAPVGEAGGPPPVISGDTEAGIKLLNPETGEQILGQEDPELPVSPEEGLEDTRFAIAKHFELFPEQGVRFVRRSFGLTPQQAREFFNTGKDLSSDIIGKLQDFGLRLGGREFSLPQLRVGTDTPATLRETSFQAQRETLGEGGDPTVNLDKFPITKSVRDRGLAITLELLRQNFRFDKAANKAAGTSKDPRKTASGVVFTDRAKFLQAEIADVKGIIQALIEKGQQVGKDILTRRDKLLENQKTLTLAATGQTNTDAFRDLAQRNTEDAAAGAAFFQEHGNAEETFQTAIEAAGKGIPVDLWKAIKANLPSGLHQAALAKINAAISAGSKSIEEMIKDLEEEGQRRASKK